MKTRRQFLTNATLPVAAAVALSVPAVARATADQDAEIVGLAARLAILDEKAKSLTECDDSSAIDVITEEGSVIAKRMLVIRPTTLEGHRAKARAFVWCADEMPEHNYFGTTTDARMAVAIIRDLLEFGGAA